MSITLTHPLSLTRRRIITVAAAAAIGLGGAGAVVAATQSDSGSGQPAAMKVLRDNDGMCWYKGWFVDGGGVPYQGYFKASC